MPDPKVHEVEDVINSALKLLSYRPRSEAEVRRRLSRRFLPELVEEAILHLMNLGLLDDAAFASYWRENREMHRPRGARALRWELSRMGVARGVVEEALTGLDEEENAYRAASKLFRRLVHASNDDFRNKLSTYLSRRGFSSEAVSTTIERCWGELSDPAYGNIQGDSHRH